MEKTIEKTNAELVRRKVRDSLKQLDIKRTKPTFYTRLLDDRIEFIHLHKFTFGPYFRVHSGIRFLVDDFEAVELNGIDSDIFKSEYNLRYHKSEESVERCANEIMLFIQKEALPWIEKWRSREPLYNEQNSPLRTDINSNYEKFINGNEETFLSIIKQSRSLLGIRD